MASDDEKNKTESEEKTSEEETSEEETSEEKAEKPAAAADAAEDDEEEDEDDDENDEEEVSSKAADEDDEEDEEEEVAAAPPKKGAPPEPAHAHAAESHGHDDHHGFAHVTPLALLFGVLGALLVLTIVTVAVTKIDLGGQWNLVVAMVIATIKAGLVVTYFMHLRWDRTFNVLVFLSSVLFLILFLSLSLTDRKEYQGTIDLLEQTQTQPLTQ